MLLQCRQDTVLTPETACVKFEYLVFLRRPHRGAGAAAVLLCSLASPRRSRSTGGTGTQPFSKEPCASSTIPTQALRLGTGITPALHASGCLGASQLQTGGYNLAWHRAKFLLGTY